MKRLIGLMASAALALVVATPVKAAEHAAVGSEKCAKMCHKTEYASWLESKHAKAAKKTECETCHGNGADYMKLSVMKDPVKAKEAGLTAKPTQASCSASGCHKAGDIKADMLPKVHAHKAKK